MFDKKIKFLESKLNVPYPERRMLLKEVESDLNASFAKYKKLGFSDERAEARALEEFLLSQEHMKELEQIHRTKIKNILDEYPESVSNRVYDFVGMIPTLVMLGILYKEVRAMNFFVEGGLITYGILFLGLFGIALQLRGMFRWWIVRDHSAASLSLHTRLPLYVGFAVFLLGVLGTALAYYVVFYRWSSVGLSESDFRIGLREPIPCVILGSSLAAIIFMLQGSMEHWLRQLPNHQVNR